MDKFLNGDYLKVPVLEKGKHVLEVKFDEILPSHIKNLIQSKVLLQRSFSKYYLGRLAVQDKKNIMKNTKENLSTLV